MSSSRSRRQQQHRNSNIQLVERQPDHVQQLEETLQRVEQALWEARNSSRGQLTKSMAWDESEALGIPSTARRINNLSDKEYKDTLCKAYINMPWIAACIDARVLRLVSGTWELEPTCEDADEGVRDEILKLLLYINDDEDLMQLIYSYGLDLMIYGEAFIELVREKDGNPTSPIQSLHKVDCQTMVYDLDDHGNIKMYKQLLTHQTEPIPLEPYRVMRTWFPSPESSKKALSPIAKLMNSAMLYEQMMEWARSFFKKGARPPFSFEHPGDKRKADEFLLWLKENFTGKQNAHIPLMTYDGVKMQYAPSGPIELDFLKGLEWVRQETLSNLQTPPASIGIVESANLGSGTGDSQSKTFLNNAVKPVDRLIMEKFNYLIIRKGFNTNQWKLVLHPASYADDEAVAELEDKRIRNGSSTPNEARIAQGKTKYKGMGDTPVIVTTKEVTPLDRLDQLSAEQTEQSQLSIGQAQAQLDMTKVQIDKAKNPPPPPPAPVVVAPGQPDQPQPPTNPPSKPKTPSAQSQDDPQESSGTDKEAHNRYLRDLQCAVVQVDEVLTRADEHLRMIRMEKVGTALSDEERRYLTEIKQAINRQEGYLTQSLQATQENKPASRIITVSGTDQKGQAVHEILDLQPYTTYSANNYASIDTAFPITSTENEGETDEDRSEQHDKESENINEEPMEEDHTAIPATVEHVSVGREDSDTGGEQVKQSSAHVHTSGTELIRWRTRAVRDTRARRSLRPFESDILPLRTINDIQVQLEGATSEEAIRAIFETAIQGGDTAVDLLAEKKTAKTGWRPPSAAQLALEKNLTTSIKAFIATAKITKGGVVLPDEVAHEHLQYTLHVALTAANHEGVQIIRGAQEGVVSTAKDFASHAASVIAAIIAQLKEKAQSIIDAALADDSVDPSDVEQVVEKQVGAWAENYGEMVAQSEVHTAVESAVVAETQNQGHNAIIWNAGPNACDRCKANAAASPVRIGVDLPSGDTVPPAHVRCDCTASEADIDNEEE
jgi:phage portal protein BeeE